MKKYISLFIIISATMMVSCSEESPVEGLINTKSSVVTLNTEVAAGNTKTITLMVNNKNLQLQVQSNLVVANGIEYRHCMLTMLNGTGFFPVVANSIYIKGMDAGAEISAGAFSSQLYIAYLYSTSRAVNTANYTYTSNNGMRFGQRYFVPLKVMPANNGEAPIYAYLEFSIAADKVVLHKMVYRSVGSLSAGGE